MVLIVYIRTSVYFKKLLDVDKKKEPKHKSYDFQKCCSFWFVSEAFDSCLR